MTGRKPYNRPNTRPQAVIWSNNPGTIVDGLYMPSGAEIGANPAGIASNSLNQFLILSDHNRSGINFSTTRIEERKRTINGRMRSYHIADKLQISWSWNNLPSRAYDSFAAFDANGKADLQTTVSRPNPQEFTVDGGAGGVELLDWYEKHKGPFWMILAYDNYRNFPDDSQQFKQLDQYNEILEVYFSDFNYSVVKRGGNNHDLWNVSVSLEQV
jgi:hypothetical protein